MTFYLLSATLAILTIYQWSPRYVSADTCIITNYDANDIQTAQNECTEITIDGIEVPAGETLALTQLRPTTRVIFSGTITWGYQEWEGPLISIAGTNIEILGSSGHVLDGRGSLWWDDQGGNGGKTKPKFFKINLLGSQIHDINIKDSPVNVISIIDSSDLAVTNVTIDNSAGDSGGALNTDGFDLVTSSNIRITNCTILNQGDCLAIYSGSNIRFSDSYCSGGLGITIGPVGDNAVSNFIINNCVITNSDNGVRIITVSGGTSGVSDITYEGITLSSIHKYGIVIEGDYANGTPTGTPTSGVPISNLRVSDVHGTVDSSGVNVYILVDGATNWQFTGINVSGGTQTQTCSGIPPNAGISC